MHLPERRISNILESFGIIGRNKNCSKQSIHRNRRHESRKQYSRNSGRTQRPLRKLIKIQVAYNRGSQGHWHVLENSILQRIHRISGRERKKGIETAYEVSPDLIISDVMMPIMNGFELARALKEDINTCHIPIILLTALTSDEDVMKGMELGADDYVMKPFNSEILKSKVKRLIKNRIELKKAYTKLLVTSTPTKLRKRKRPQKKQKLQKTHS